MGNPDTREKLLAAAKHLFLVRGYAGTSVDLICAEAGVSKGSFYHFYASKEALAIGVLQWSLEKTGALLNSGRHSEMDDPVAAGFAYLERLEECADRLWSDGCILATFSNELAETNPRLQQEVAATFTIVLDGTAQWLAPIAAQWEGSPTAHELAEDLLIAIEGTVVLAKAFRQPDRIPKSLAKFRHALKERLAATRRAA